MTRATALISAPTKGPHFRAALGVHTVYWLGWLVMMWGYNGKDEQGTSDQDNHVR